MRELVKYSAKKIHKYDIFAIPIMQFTDSNRLRIASIIILVILVLLSPFIREKTSRESAEFVKDNQSAHDGLPMDWEDKQVICVLFPEENQHKEYNEGITMIDRSGEIMDSNPELNGTGACIGGFSSYTNGLDFAMDATRIANGKLSIAYEDGDWGPFVHTIGGLNADEISGDFNGAYWKLDHNGETSMVGIGDLVMSEGDVLLWSISTW